MCHLFPLQFYTICLVSHREWIKIDEAMFVPHGIQVVSFLFGIDRYDLSSHFLGEMCWCWPMQLVFDRQTIWRSMLTLSSNSEVRTGGFPTKFSRIFHRTSNTLVGNPSVPTSELDDSIDMLRRMVWRSKTNCIGQHKHIPSRIWPYKTYWTMPKRMEMTWIPQWMNMASSISIHSRRFTKQMV